MKMMTIEIHLDAKKNYLGIDSIKLLEHRKKQKVYQTRRILKSL